MKKIVMFFGSDRAFVERIPKAYRNLSDIAMQMDDENKQIHRFLPIQITRRYNAF